MDSKSDPALLSASNASRESSSAGLTATSSNLSSSPTATQFARRVPLSPTTVSAHARRPSVAESLRNIPGSPGRQRQPSITQAAAQELVNHPPHGQKSADSKFAGKEWRELTIGELITDGEVLWAEMDTSVEEATKLLIQARDNVVLLRESADSQNVVSTFNYTDLLSYLLVVIGLAKPEPEQVELYNSIGMKMQNGERILLKEIQDLSRKESLVMLPATDGLSQAIEILGSGIHQLLATDKNGTVVGVLSQLRVMNFFWNEGVNFPSIDRLYPVSLRDLSSTLGHKPIISINSDAPLKEALTLMNDEGISSIAVVDNGMNVVGNISTKDVRLLTHGSNAPLLSSSCMHFISLILSERGMENGQDAFPVFYVNPFSTLAHTVAKLVATGSQRMWVVEDDSKSPTQPATPLLAPTTGGSVSSASGGPPTSPVPSAAVPASAMAGARMSGKLTGVISLTDILNMFAKYTGLHPADPDAQRARRRRSSSSSMRPSIDASSGSIDKGR
ncbi:hypothetical protein CC79DRAFT_525198 [Sarocladium strictum]